MVARIKFKITQAGEVEVEVFEAKGNQCENMTRPFESVLGELQERTHKDDYYAETEEKRNQETQ